MSRQLVEIYFNFRSPYCYLASKHMFQTLAQFDVELSWRPFSGWDGRSAPDRQKSKLRVVRQDVKRFCARMNIPFNPPPMHTDGTLAGRVSLLAEERGLLSEWVAAVMHAEWGEGRDIGDPAVLAELGVQVGLSAQEVQGAIDSESYQTRLETHWQQAQEAGVFGVPTFVVGEELFWGNDRIDFLAEYLQQQGA